MNIHALCRGTAEAVPGKRYKSGIWKAPLNAAVMVDAQGLVGDAICNRRHHGGPDQAIYVEGRETLIWWEEQLGHPLVPGAFGENLVIDGLDNRDLGVGDRLVIGDVVLEATSARIPCATFAIKMGDPQFPRRYTKAARPGAYFRVIAGGMLEAGQEVQLRPFDGTRVTIAELMANFGKKPDAETLGRYLSTPINSRLTMLTGADMPSR